MPIGSKDEQMTCLFFGLALSSGNPMPEGGDAPARFANAELLPVISTFILKRKWRRTKID
jgi:hypothetical protein